MSLNSLLTWAIVWLGLDALADALCIALALAVFASVQRYFRKSN